MVNAAVTIAANVFKTYARDKIFYGALIFSFGILLVAQLLSNLTIVEQRKILIDFAFAAISICGIIFAIVLGVLSIAREVKSKSIYTVISKPVARWTYVIGNFIGLMVILFFSHLIMSLALVLILLMLGHTVPGGIGWCFLLMYLESVTILALSLMFSFFTTPALASVFSVLGFLVGRSSYTLVLLSERAESEFLRHLFSVAHTLMPDLIRYDIRQLVAYGKEVPETFVAWGVFYFVLYTLACLALSLIIFERRELP